MKIDFHMKTDIGLVRKVNEDSLGVSEMFNLFVVADGMGGYEQGKDASLTVVNTIKGYVEEKCFSSQSINENIVKEAVSMANSAIQKKTKPLQIKNPNAKMGSTMVLLVIKSEQYLFSNIGDSRIYLLRDNELSRVTKDHSLIQESADNNIDVTEISGKIKNIITRAIGVGPSVAPDFYYMPPREKDIILLCSDGLHGLVPDPEIKSILLSSLSLQDAAERLIEKAKEKGGNDNVTVVLVKVKELPKKGQSISTTVKMDKISDKTTDKTALKQQVAQPKITESDWMILIFIFLFLVLLSSFYYIMIFKI
jgi:PPM family protein phosphatase